MKSAVCTENQPVVDKLLCDNILLCGKSGEHTNTYIMDACKRYKGVLFSDDSISPDCIDDITGKFLMIKMEIEQHIANVPTFGDYKSTLDAAQNAVQPISEILHLLVDLPYSKNS